MNQNHANTNVNFMEENVIQTNGGITINADVSEKNVVYLKKIIFGILLHLVVELIRKYLPSIMDDSVLCIM